MASKPFDRRTVALTCLLQKPTEERHFATAFRCDRKTNPNPILVSTLQRDSLNSVHLCSGYSGAVGTTPTDLQHHQAGAEEEPTGRAGCPEVLRLQRNREQPEVHELHLRR